MEKQRKVDQNRTARNGGRCAYISRVESETTRGRVDTSRGRLCRSFRFFNRLGGKKTKQQTENVIPASTVQDQPTEDETFHDKTEDSGFHADFTFEGNTLENDQKEKKNFDASFPEVENAWEPVKNCPSEIMPAFLGRRSTPKSSCDSVTSTSAVIVVDDSRCDTSVMPREFQATVKARNSPCNILQGHDVSVDIQNISNSSSGNVSELKPSGSTTAKDIAEVLDAHIARERRISAALSSHVAKVTEWKREVSLHESTESVLGLLSGHLLSLSCNQELNVKSRHRGFASNIGSTDAVLPEDDEEGQDFESDEALVEADDDDDAVTDVTLELNGPLSSNPLRSAASLLSSKAGSLRTGCWGSHLVDAATSAQSTSVVAKEEAATAITPVVSHLTTADVTHIDESGSLSKQQQCMRVKWDGGWKSSSKEEDSTYEMTLNNVGSSVSFASPSCRCSSPALSFNALDNPSTLIFSDERDHHCPSPSADTDTEAGYRKLAHLLELSADEQPWFGDLSFEWSPEDLTKEPWPHDVKLYEPILAQQMLLPDNANCLAVEAFLKMCKLDYTVEQRSNAEFMVPCGKVPFIKCGAHVVAGLESIVSFVGNKGIFLTSDLSSQDKGDMRAYMSLITTTLANAELYLTWCDPVTYKEVTKPRYGSVFPWPLGPILCWQKKNAVVKRLSILTWAKKSLEEVYSEVDKCFQSLSERLGDNNFFFGEKYNELDAFLFGHLFNIMTTPLPHPNDMLSTLVREYPALVHFCQRIQKKFFANSCLTRSRSTLNFPPLKPYTYHNEPIAALQ